MKKKTVLAELDYIFNIIKSSFHPQALAKYLTAKGQWDKFVKDKAKSFGIKVPGDFKIENVVRKLVNQQTNKFEDESDLVQDWVMAYLFLPEALDALDVDEETGKEYWKSRGITDVFTTFDKVRREHPDKEHNFAGFVSTSIPRVIKMYIREEKKREEPFLDESADSAVSQRMRKKIPHGERLKHEVQKDEGGETIPFGVQPGDIDKIQNIGDFRDDVIFKELTNNAVKYVKEHASENASKVFELRLNEEINLDMIAKKLSRSKQVITDYLHELEQVLLSFADKYKNADLTRLIQRMIEKTKGTSKVKKSSLTKLAEIVNELESIFPEVPKKDAQKIASITQYIRILSDRIA